MGAGAVGCYFGGLLSLAGYEVAFVGKPSHVNAINDRGLMLETQAFYGHVRVRAVTELSSLDRADLVLFCVKSNDTETAAKQLLPGLHTESLVLSLQNGVDNAERLSSVINQSVIPCVVYVGAEMAGAGHVKHHGGGELVIGESAKSDELAGLLCRAQIPSKVTSDIKQELWIKLITNCAYNALSAVAAMPYGPLLEVDGTRDVIINTVRECVAVAGGCGVSVPSSLLDKVLSIADRMPSQLSSTAQDLVRGKRSEIDFLNGYVVRKGAELGIPTPSNQALQVMVKLSERGRELTRL
jgi:2-dehydropantoate 2-reductase